MQIDDNCGGNLKLEIKSMGLRKMATRSFPNNSNNAILFWKMAIHQTEKKGGQVQFNMHVSSSLLDQIFLLLISLPDVCWTPHSLLILGSLKLWFSTASYSYLLILLIYVGFVHKILDSNWPNLSGYSLYGLRVYGR